MKKRDRWADNDILETFRKREYVVLEVRDGMTLTHTGSIKRLKHRSKVDFPQPLGPINAVTFFSGISRLIACKARVSP